MLRLNTDNLILLITADHSLLLVLSSLHSSFTANRVVPKDNCFRKFSDSSCPVLCGGKRESSSGSNRRLALTRLVHDRKSRPRRCLFAALIRRRCLVLRRR